MAAGTSFPICERTRGGRRSGGRRGSWLARSDVAKLEVVQTLRTAAGARTIAIDATARRIYLPTAEYGERAADASGGRGRRPAMKPGSFKIVVVGV